MTLHDDCGGTEYDMALGTVTGLRSFNADNQGFLRSASYSGYTWRPGINTAECAHVTGMNAKLRTHVNRGFQKPKWTMQRADDGQFSFIKDPHPEPYKEVVGRCGNDDHGCGFWAYHDGSTYPEGNVTGIISAWGKTTIGTKGFRSDFAKVEALFIGERPTHVSTRKIASGCAIIALYLVAMVIFIMTNPDVAALAAPLLGGTVGAAIALFGLYVQRTNAAARRASSQRLSKSTINLVKEHYPDVMLYTNYKKMLKDWPPSYKKDHVK